MADSSNSNSTPASRRKIFRTLFAVSLSINVLCIGFITYRIINKGGMRYLLERLDLGNAEPTLVAFQKDDRARMRKLPNAAGEVVFVGDSLIAAGPWAELYSLIKNRGIGGETTAGLLDRLDEVTESRPRKIFLLIGTNCLAADIPVAQVVRNYRKILDRIKEESPTTKIYVIGVLPVNQHFPQGPVHNNSTIHDLNDRLKMLAGEFGNVEYIDASSCLSDPQGDLKKEFTDDGLHLTLDGYLVLGKFLENYVLAAETAGSRSAP